MHYALSIRYYIVLIITLLVFASCGGKKGELRIKGEIKGLNNAELTIYSRDGVIHGIDTLHVVQGKIDWSCPFNRKGGSLTIVYPTFSTLTVFGSSGDIITIEGKAQHLSATKVGGNDDNIAYTLLREKLEEFPQKKDSLIEDFINTHKESPVARMLQIDILSKQTPQPLRTGEMLPDFSIITRQGDTITQDTLKGKYTLLAFWANWRGGTSTMNSKIRRLRKQAQVPFECISYNLDVSKTILEYIERTDSILWYSYNDQNLFQADLPSRLGIRDIPYYILTDTTNHIITSGGDWAKDIEPSLKLITSPKDE